MNQTIGFLAEQALGSRRTILLEDIISVATVERDPADTGTNLKRLVLLSFAFWTIPVMYRFVQSYIAHVVLDLPARLPLTVSYILVDWYYWAAITPLVFWLGDRFPLATRMSLRNLAIHLPIAILAACVHVFLISIFLNMGTPEATFKEIFVRAASNFNDSFLIYAGILAVCFSLVYSRRFRERELQTADLKNELSQAQLRALQMQLQPHFLFNTLNSISALTHKNPTAANTMIAQLSDLLRVLLKKEPPQEITLEEELGFLRTYLEIERVRFDDRLELEFNIELETLKAQIPSLILQPLIENSIRHGISKRRGSGIIRITSEKVRNRLFLEVYDNGLGLPMGMDDVTFAEGIGLRNTRHRLRKLYGEHHRFDIVAGTNQRGVRITMIIPFRTEKNGKDQNPDSR
jgi:hypothetical protein